MIIVNKDILLIQDWIKISIKFSGPCSICGQKVLSGKYGYWSKASKSIIHNDCYNLAFLTSETNKQSIDNIHTSRKNQEIVTLETYIQEQMNKKKCFICNKVVNLHDNLVVMLLQLEKNFSKLDTIYCSSCLYNFDSNNFSNYKSVFSSKL